LATGEEAAKKPNLRMLSGIADCVAVDLKLLNTSLSPPIARQFLDRSTVHMAISHSDNAAHAQPSWSIWHDKR
jgi:hypothetical protein